MTAINPIGGVRQYPPISNTPPRGYGEVRSDCGRCPSGSNLADYAVAAAWQEEAQPLRSVDENESLE